MNCDTLLAIMYPLDQEPVAPRFIRRRVLGDADPVELPFPFDGLCEDAVLLVLLELEELPVGGATTTTPLRRSLIVEAD